MQKIFVYGKSGLNEYQFSPDMLSIVQDDLKIKNRTREPHLHESCIVSEVFPPPGFTYEKGNLIEMPMEQKLKLGLVKEPEKTEFEVLRAQVDDLQKAMVEMNTKRKEK